ncbi:MAG: EamA/RhaT family transporter [Clostridiales bacterium]|nr:EamA/RhaT family transporter [Clostridiales bacterium]
MTTEKTKKANYAFILSMIIFGTIGIFRRYIPLPSGMIAFARGLIGMLFLLAYTRVRGIRISFADIRKNGLKLFLSGIFLGFNWILLFEAYRYTSVAVATLCYYMAPILVILVSPILFRESLTPVKIVCVAVAFLGMVLVSGVTNISGVGKAEITGILLGLGAAVLYACVVLMNKKISGISAYDKTIVQLGTAAAVILPYTLLTEQVAGQAWSGLTIICLLLVGVVHTGVAYALYFGSVSEMKAQTAALLSYLDPVVAILLSALLLGERMTLAGAIGAVLVLGAAILSEVEWPARRSESKKR